MYEEHGMDCISYFETDYPCSVCDRWCISEKDLNRHIKVYHGNRIKLCSLQCNICDENVSDGEEGSIESMSKHHGIQKSNCTVKCNFCDEKFTTRRCLMVHKKEVHREKIAVCWNFVQGNCTFGDKLCWVSHTIDKTMAEAEFNCNLCGKVFITRSLFLEHRKKEHDQAVQKCKNENNGKCIFGSETCWFIHENTNNKEENINHKNNENKNNIKDSENTNVENNMIQKMMTMMETFTERILKLEEIELKLKET